MPTPSDAASAHVLDEAERHFLAHGFAGTRLRDVATALGIRPASLYHHAPGGKADLWTRVVGRALERHRVGLAEAARASGPDLRLRLEAMADWLLAQPPVSVLTLGSAAGAPPGYDPADALERIYAGLMTPVADVFREGQARGDVAPDLAPDLLAGVFVAAIQGLAPASAAGALPRPATDLAREVVRVLLRGVGTE